MRYALIALLIGVSAASAQTRPAPEVIKVAEGIYLFRTAPYSDVGLDGNSIAIISNDGVLVFDSNGTPAAASAVLSEIRKLTKQPVRYLVNSHWHWDHWYGAEVYKKEFPTIQIVTHELSRRLMMGPAIEFNRSGIEEQLPAHIADVEKSVKDLETSKPGSDELAKARKHLADDKWFLAQKTGVHHTVANVTYSDSLTIYMGEREIRVLHYDRAVTPGDSFLYLPKEKVLITGDLLINPMSFALVAYPTGWLHTLEKMDSLEAVTIVPGHGTPINDKALLETHIAVFRELLRIGAESKAQGLDPDKARAVAMPVLKDLMVKMTGDDPGKNQQFAIYVVDWFMHRVYDELDGRLTDSIGPLPRH